MSYYPIEEKGHIYYEYFLNTPYEALIGFSIIVSVVIIWSFFKMKKENPSDLCSRVVRLPLIPAIIACTLKSYCRQENINGYFAYFSKLLFWISCAGIVITAAVALFISYKQKGEYYERIKSNKSILIFCGVGAIICALVVLYAKIFM